MVGETASSRGSANAHWPDRLLPRTGTGRGRERGLLGRGEKFCRDGEEAVPMRWCHRKGLPAMMLCPIPSSASTHHSVVSAWNGDRAPLPQLLLFMAPQPGQHPSSELRYQQGLGTWVYKPHLALLHGGARAPRLQVWGKEEPCSGEMASPSTTLTRRPVWTGLRQVPPQAPQGRFATGFWAAFWLMEGNTVV